MFNGNLVLPYRLKQLGQWINTQLLNKIAYLELALLRDPILMKPDLSDAWLSGFTDAEGCFNFAIQPRHNTVTGFRISLQFLLVRKVAESSRLRRLHIRDLFKIG